MSEAQAVTIDLGSDDRPFFCPWCGRRIFQSDEQLPAEFCPHVEFVHTDLGGGYEYLTPSMQEVVETLDDLLEEDEVVEPTDDGMLRHLPADTVVFRLVTSGFACGPMGSTLSIGVRPAPDPGNA